MISPQANPQRSQLVQQKPPVTPRGQIKTPTGIGRGGDEVVLQPPAPQYSNDAFYHDLQARQRPHSTPVKQTAAAGISPLVELRRQQANNDADRHMDMIQNRRVVGDKNYGPAITRPHTLTGENIYESTSNLRPRPPIQSFSPVHRPHGIQNNGIVQSQQVPRPGSAQSSQLSLNNNSTKQPLSRNEIYAHLYAFYQKSRRNSVSSETLPSSIGRRRRRRSRNSGWLGGRKQIDSNKN